MAIKKILEAPYLCKKELLALVGAAAPSRLATPYGDENFEIWTMSVLVTFPDFKRADLFFELHTEGYWGHKDVTERLKKIKQPIYMQEKQAEFPNSIRYPIEIIKQYRRYHTSSVSFMLALAYHSFLTTGNPKHVALFGLVMACDEEYGEQRPCCEYWLGVMEGAGIDIEIAPGSAILASPGLYGYETYNPIIYDINQRIDGINIGLKQSENELEKWKEQKARQEGGLAENQYWKNRFTKGAFY